MQENTKVSFITMGCRSNFADTIDLQSAIVENGLIPCEFGKFADVVVINTCAVTDSAERDAIKLIKKAKEINPNAKVIVTGCMAESSPEKILSTSLVDSVVGPGRKKELVNEILGKDKISETLFSANSHPESIQRRVKKSLPQRISISLDERISRSTAGPGEFLGEVRSRSRYHLRIQEGCENSCTFCIIPQTRGRLSSRKVELILDDIRYLSEKGYNEIVLTGTHIGGYGEDLGINFNYLLDKICKQNLIHRFRLSSIDPNDLSKEIIDLVVDSSIFCKHFHICVQAFCDKTLKLMNRRYRMSEVADKMCYIQTKFPGVCIGADIITGFPGESRQEVEQGIKTFLELPISYLHVFPYSERQDTAALNIKKGIVPVRERKQRAKKFRSLSDDRKKKFYSSFIGGDLEVIAESIDGSWITGTSNEFISVKIKRDDLSTKSGSIIYAKAISYDETEGVILCQ